MQKKILLAVDDSAHSKRAIQYVGRMSSNIKNLNYVLFHCCPVNFFEKQVNYMNLN